MLQVCYMICQDYVGIVCGISLLFSCWWEVHWKRDVFKPTAEQIIHATHNNTGTKIKHHNQSFLIVIMIYTSQNNMITSIPTLLGKNKILRKDQILKEWVSTYIAINHYCGVHFPNCLIFTVLTELSGLSGSNPSYAADMRRPTGFCFCLDKAILTHANI